MFILSWRLYLTNLSMIINLLMVIPCLFSIFNKWKIYVFISVLLKTRMGRVTQLSEDDVHILLNINIYFIQRKCFSRMRCLFYCSRCWAPGKKKVNHFQTSSQVVHYVWHTFWYIHMLSYKYSTYTYSNTYLLHLISCIYISHKLAKTYYIFGN